MSPEKAKLPDDAESPATAELPATADIGTLRRFELRRRARWPSEPSRDRVLEDLVGGTVTEDRRRISVVVLTDKGSVYGKKMIRALSAEGLAVSAVVVRQPPRRTYRLLRSVARRVGLLNAALSAVKRVADRRRQMSRLKAAGSELLNDYGTLCGAVRFVGNTNGAETQQALRDFDTDLLVLGQAGIVRKPVLDIPRIGTLNAHPGILPFYRGIDCPQWALLNGDVDKIGVSVHWVDQGVDTGPLIVSQPYPIGGLDDLSAIEERLYDLCVEMMAEVVVVIAGGLVPEGTVEDRSAGRQYYKMPFWTERRLDATLKRP